MEITGSASRSLEIAQAILERGHSALAEGHVTPEIISAVELAETQAEVQVELLKDAIEAESLVATQLVDLLA